MSLLTLVQWSGNLKLVRNRGNMKTVYYTQNDRLPELTITLYDEDGAVVDLSSATITFSMVNKIDGNVKLNKQSCSLVTDGSDGKFKYSWASGDLDTAGIFLGEFEITISTKVETTNEIFQINVRKELN